MVLQPIRPIAAQSHLRWARPTLARAEGMSQREWVQLKGFWEGAKGICWLRMMIDKDSAAPAYASQS